MSGLCCASIKHCGGPLRPRFFADMKFKLIIAALFATLSAQAQSGDKAGEVQRLLVPEHLIPPAPVLTPEEALKSFQLKPGFRIEIVAAEPLVNTPVAMEFDPDGRLWVVEMTGYMPNPDGIGEDEPTGSIVVLEDTDGDGRMDKRTVFLDKLVMPRAITLVPGGVLVAEMPNLWFCRDTDGDLKCDEKTAIATDYVQGDIKNPEHNANGLMWGLDNWIYSANYTTRFRHTDGTWRREPTVFRGQWGLSQDDFGRQVYDSNSDQLRIDLVPAEYLLRNPNHASRSGINVDPVRSQLTFPARVNPGVNRGYQKGVLREDGFLARFTAACGPAIYRGDNFPPEFLGNAFVCEPSGNLVKRNILEEKDGIVTGRFAYPDSEFLTSTDERFRPVNAYNGPDGALYVVDMYRGLIQHRIYLTTYLRGQVESRNLQTPVNLGRIYRIVHEGKPLNRAPKLAKAGAPELVQALEHPNGWVRDTAQRLLVGQRNDAVVADLQKLALSEKPVTSRVHALWTLDGMGKVDAKLIRNALATGEPKVQVAALRIADANPDLHPELEADVLALTANAAPEVEWQLAFSLGNYPSPAAFKKLAELAVHRAESVYLRDAALSGVGGREVEFLKAVLAHEGVGETTSPLLQALAAAIVKEARPERIASLLALAAGQSQQNSSLGLALLNGAAANLPRAQAGRPAPKINALELGAEPEGLIALRQTADPAIRETLAKLDPLFTWPGKAATGTEVRPLNETERQWFTLGKELYSISCGACHQPHGNGQEGLAPPLAGSEWVTGSEERLIRIALHGMMGPVTVKDKKWDMIMPGLGIFEDEQIAGILTYIRREWGNTADPVTPASVKKVRDQYPDRDDLWTEAELLKID
jgi:glucose/arabinose dehydrogenase/mono/diheme cytochrome c family protein/HEAT repeat protein